MLVRADNSSLQSLHDLKGQSFMAVRADAFGGFQMAWRGLKDAGVDPFRAFSELRFVGFPQDEIVLAVRDGKVDAATVRAETLARMVEAGTVGSNEFRILNVRQTAGSSVPHSTRLYPEWPFATLKDTPRELATSVTQALLSMPPDHSAALSSRTAGWTIPIDTANEKNKRAARDFLDFLRSTQAQVILERAGFIPATQEELTTTVPLPLSSPGSAR